MSSCYKIINDYKNNTNGSKEDIYASKSSDTLHIKRNHPYHNTPLQTFYVCAGPCQRRAHSSTIYRLHPIPCAHNRIACSKPLHLPALYKQGAADKMLHIQHNTASGISGMACMGLPRQAAGRVFHHILSLPDNCSHSALYSNKIPGKR